MSTNESNRWALLIGINQYPCLDARYQLQGCKNDVEVMADLLRDKFGFLTSNITVLSDTQATQANIRQALETLMDQVKQDDIVVVHYSGHGSQVRDIHGDEASGLDSTLVPSDSGRGRHPNRDITDDELHLWLARLGRITPYTTLIFDCCHSGTISRGTFGDASRWVEPDMRPREEIAAQMEMPALTAAQITELRDLGVGGSGWLPLGQGYVLLAGCQDEESSYEHTVADGATPLKHGALTYFLIQELTHAGPGTTYRDVFERTSLQVTLAHARQHPQIEGRQDRELFGLHDIEPLHFVSVTQRAGDTVTLGAGAAHGLMVGSRWTIYPQGAKATPVMGAALGVVEITAVRVVTSDAQILDPAQAAGIATNCRAVETERALGAMHLLVELSAAPAGYEQAVADLKTCLDASRLLRVCEPGVAVDAADVCVQIALPQVAAGPGGVLPELGAMTTVSWVVIGRDGQLAMPVHSVTEHGVLDLLCKNFELLSRYRNALALTNFDVNNPLIGKVDMILKRRKADGTWETALPDPASGQVIFNEGDVIAFEIMNRYRGPVYISVLDFGLAGGISLLHPPQRNSEKLERDTTVVVGVRQADEIELFFPDGFTKAAGFGTFKLFATAGPTDFTWLEQEGMRGAKPATDGLRRFFDLAYLGGNTRDARQRAPVPDEQWITVERPFYLKRLATPP